MAEKNKRQLQSIETRLKITRVSIALFKEQGMSNVTVRDICREASISIGNFYHHFKSREEIINTVHQQLDLLWESTLPGLDLTRSVRENILSLFDEAGRVMLELGWEMTAHSYVHLLTSDKKYAVQRDRPIYTHLKEVIDAGVKKDEFYPEADLEHLIELLITCGRGILFDWCLMEGSYDLGRKLRKDLAVIVDGFCR
ncbi:MAG: TetR/AcrR family transcriptional regulator [Spirochaetales bacterium]|nr:TetR/AcrR family transcriptional regulator [Spirochaetales bacterium]